MKFLIIAAEKPLMNPKYPSRLEISIVASLNDRFLCLPYPSWVKVSTGFTCIAVLITYRGYNKTPLITPLIAPLAKRLPDFTIRSVLLKLSDYIKFKFLIDITYEDDHPQPRTISTFSIITITECLPSIVPSWWSHFCKRMEATLTSVSILLLAFEV